MKSMAKILVAAGVVASALVLGGTASADRGNQRSLPFYAVVAGMSVDANGNPVIQTADSGSGRATHLGRFTLAAGEKVNLGTKTVTEGVYTLTAANGDTVTGTYSGQALPDLTGYLVSGPITGGTGRFAGATGFLVWHGKLDPVAFTFSDVIVGVISLPGSERGEGDD
jgi:hypothetical protein